MGWFHRWRQARLLRRHRIPAVLWARVLADVPLLQRYDRVDRHRLRVLASRFLHEKVINGAGGVEPEPYMEVVIAAQACVPILNLGLEYYSGWKEIILYPDSFRVEVHYQDEAGVSHESAEWRSGEAWEQGPMVLAWEEIDPHGPHAREPGLNVVIHEFAHKLDLLNGVADGFPPLHQGMPVAEWNSVFTNLFKEINKELDADCETLIDPYAASHPAEFFAVVSEYFFTLPDYLAEIYPQLYRQLARFYRQQPRGNG